MEHGHKINVAHAMARFIFGAYCVTYKAKYEFLRKLDSINSTTTLEHPQFSAVYSGQHRKSFTIKHSFRAYFLFRELIEPDACMKRNFAKCGHPVEKELFPTVLPPYQSYNKQPASHIPTARATLATEA